VVKILIPLVCAGKNPKSPKEMIWLNKYDIIYNDACCFTVLNLL